MMEREKNSFLDNLFLGFRDCFTYVGFQMDMLLLTQSGLGFCFVRKILFPSVFYSYCDKEQEFFCSFPTPSLN